VFGVPSILLRFASQAKSGTDLARFLLRYTKMLGGDNQTVKEITGKSCRCFEDATQNQVGLLIVTPVFVFRVSDQVLELLEGFDLDHLACGLWRIGDGFTGPWVGASTLFGCRLGVDVDLDESRECEDPGAFGDIFRNHGFESFEYGPDFLATVTCLFSQRVQDFGLGNRFRLHCFFGHLRASPIFWS